MKQSLDCQLQSPLLQVNQPTADVTAAEGHTVTLDCSFETSVTSNANLFWYKQEENYFVRFLTQHHSSEKGQKSAGRFHTEIKNKSVPLTIQTLQVSDSAVYYFANPLLAITASSL
uniref:Ig-like domain-containing protein n=1 Tax=Seriola dumerili TaxID=41447 RepID=A0A3B4TPM9_SERDU